MELFEQSVLAIAVWGSLLASALLGLNMTVHAFLEHVRRKAFLTFALICWAVVILDYSYPVLEHENYEKLRIAVWSAYAGSLYLLMGYRLLPALLLTALLVGFGTLTWLFYDPAAATTAVVPPAFFFAAYANFVNFRKTKGYASLVLTGTFLILGLMCAFYYKVVTTGTAATIQLGYLHYAVTSLLAVLFGWVHLPRELRGKEPVRIKNTTAATFIIALLLGEAAVQFALFVHSGNELPLYLSGSAFQICTVVVLYFLHRHHLVIYAADVTELLGERTKSLREAQEALGRQNEILAQKLEEQAKELQAKAEVIDRQRRLELAAQTAGQAAHDIQNLISPVLYHLGELKRSTVSTEAERSCETVERQVHALLDLNGQLLSLSRRGRIEHSSVDLSSLCREVAERFPEQNLILNLTGCYVNGSWSQIAGAVANLVGNAVDAVQETRGRVWLEAGTYTTDKVRRCHLGFLEAGDYSFLRVRDEGSGISPEAAERIFEPFYSSKKAGTSSGSGLGLSIVAAVLDDHQGVLDLESDETGTCFTLFFKQAAAPSHVDDLSLLCGNETVVVTDDDSSVRLRCKELLESSGYQVYVASNAHETLSFLQREKVDLLLLDYSLGRENGGDIYFAAMHLQPHIKGIIYSSYLTDDEKARLSTLGICDVLMKPANPAEILKSVRRVCDQHQGENLAHYHIPSDARGTQVAKLSSQRELPRL